MKSKRVEVPAPGTGRSYWLQEALEHDPGEACPPLRGKVSADVCIAGGGFAGLWTAIELTEREPSLRVALLEADICGGGASGRNGGLFSASWYDLPVLIKMFGEDGGIRYAQALSEAVAEGGEFCRANGVEAWFHRDGMLAFAAAPWQAAERDGELWDVLERRGLSDRMWRLSSEEARSMAEVPRAAGGSFTPHGATVQPARLARGLRRVALERGVRIFEGTRVTRIDRERPVVVRTDGRGAVRADHVIVTIGAWAAGWPNVRGRLANVADFMVATEQIPERIEELGWRDNVAILDMRELLLYLRRTDDGRIAIGGGATGVLFGGHVGRSSTHDRRIAEVAAESLLWLFPQLEGVRFTHAWGGPIDMSPSFTPFYRTLPPGDVHLGLGFSGHGLAATKVGGKILASLALGLQNGWTSMPVVGDALGRFPPEPLRYPLAKLSVWGMESGDRREDEGKTRGLLRTVLANAPLEYRSRLRRRERSG